jgi:ribosomal protein S18 acetylase RimI-like enzyme
LQFPICYDFMKTGEELEICNLTRRVFNEFNAAYYSEEGARGFYSYVNQYMLSWRSKIDHFVLTAKAQDFIIGMIEIKDHEHMSLFFVEKQFQQRGVGKDLLRRSLSYCLNRKPYISNITVNSTPYAIFIYEKIGFYQIGPERAENGIYFTPMALDIRLYP